MNSYLQKIIEAKQQANGMKKERRSFKESLKGSSLKVIAEVKKGSPSKGIFASSFKPIDLACDYHQAGAAAISVITSQQGFHGISQDLIDIVENVPQIPLLRKDFIIDPLQIYETKGIGASALLLIAGVTKENTKELLDLARSLDLDVLVEVHTEKEIEIALQAGAEIIGVNNRDLVSFHVDLSTAERLSAYLPHDVVKVAESGIHSIEDAHRMRAAGYDAVLVGEALVLSNDRKHLIQGMMR